MQELAKDLLIVAMEENNSDEVAFTCNLDSEVPLDKVGIAFGTEHGVDILSDTLSNHLIVSQESGAIVILHNHPSTQTFSLEDIQFFLQYQSINVIVVVSNQGTVHYLKRDDEYNITKAFDLFKECIKELDINSSIEDLYFAALSFLTKCSEVGLYYR